MPEDILPAAGGSLRDAASNSEKQALLSLLLDVQMQRGDTASAETTATTLMSLGGTTGYAINPARDLPPRIAHSILPIRAKGPSGWKYSWVPVAGPVLGALAAVLVYGCVYICG